MKRITKILTAICLACVVCQGILTSVADAQVPYKTYTYDGYYEPIETQAAYVPYSAITKVGDTTLSAPKDMTITDDGEIYIADTGNRRILVCDLNGNYITEFGQDVLVNPMGIYVTKDKMVYVADRDAKSIFVFDQNGTVVHTYTRPNHPLYGDDMDFNPIKIVVNQAGNMFIICEANSNGVVQISPTNGGTFLGYFGTNFADNSFTQIALRLFLSDAQRAKRPSNLPPTPDNLAIDDQGLIYTVTRGEEIDTLKRLNIAGRNVMEPDIYTLYPSAVTAGNYDNVYMVSTEGYVHELSKEGDLLFIFGGKDDGRQRIGLCKKVEAVGVDNSDKVYLLDSDMNQIHIFQPTHFTDLLHQALNLYAKGRYTESKEPLTEILQMNNMYGYANKAMALAYLQEENYSMAMKYAKLSSSLSTYSDAFWEVRNIWLRNNLIPAAGCLIAFLAAVHLLKRLQKRKGIFHPAIRLRDRMYTYRLVQQLKYSFYYVKHPIDGCYGVRWEGKSSYLSSGIILAVFIVFQVISKYYSGFLLRAAREGRYTLASDIGYVILIFLVFTICNYLICTINEGEGSFKQICSSFAYCLTPYLILQPVIFLLSQVITRNEVFLVVFTRNVMFAWIIILVLISIKELNNLTVKETAKVVGLTFFTVLIIALLVFIIYVLWSQVIDFIIAISGEVVYRLGF